MPKEAVGYVSIAREETNEVFPKLVDFFFRSAVVVVGEVRTLTFYTDLFTFHPDI